MQKVPYSLNVRLVDGIVNRDFLCKKDFSKSQKHELRRIRQVNNMEQNSFDEYPVTGTVIQFIELLASIAARGMNDIGGDRNDPNQSPAN